MINYKFASSGCIASYLKYKKTGAAKSAQSFVAGFNSFENEISFVISLKKYKKSSRINPKFALKDFYAGWFMAKELAG